MIKRFRRWRDKQRQDKRIIQEIDRLMRLMDYELGQYIELAKLEEDYPDLKNSEKIIVRSSMERSMERTKELAHKISNIAGA